MCGWLGRWEPLIYKRKKCGGKVSRMACYKVKEFGYPNRVTDTSAVDCSKLLRNVYYRKNFPPACLNLG